jgi:hypothetical protein
VVKLAVKVAFIYIKKIKIKLVKTHNSEKGKDI